MVTNRVDINQVLMQMRALKAQTQQNAAPLRPDALKESLGLATEQVKKTEKTGFNQMFADAIKNVNAIQKESGRLQDAYQQGDPNVSLAQVMVASQKAQVAFQATTQVRNKLISAYEEIMKMPI